MKKDNTKVGNKTVDSTVSNDGFPQGHSDKYLEVKFDREKDSHTLNVHGINGQQVLMCAVALAETVLEQTGAPITTVLGQFHVDKEDYAESQKSLDGKTPFIKISFHDADDIKDVDCDGGMAFETGCNLYEMLVAYMSIEEEVEKNTGRSMSSLLLTANMPMTTKANG